MSRSESVIDSASVTNDDRREQRRLLFWRLPVWHRPRPVRCTDHPPSARGRKEVDMTHAVSPAADKKHLRPLELVVLAAPLLWVVLAILHPGGGDEPPPYEGIADEANKWIFVHVGQLVLTPLLAAGVWMLLDGIQSVAAKVTWAVLALWMVFFSAFDAIAGIATGVLARHANSLAGEEREGVVRAIDFLWDDSQLAGGEFSVLGNLGQGTWLVVAIAATVALWRAGVSRLVVGATLLSALFATHSGYAAAVGLAALFVAELFRLRTRSGEAAPSRAPEPA
jgi:hypothetical protein